MSCLGDCEETIVARVLSELESELRCRNPGYVPGGELAVNAEGLVRLIVWVAREVVAASEQQEGS